MIKVFLALLIISSTMFAKVTEESLMEELNHLTNAQYKVLLKTYKKGSVFDFELSMTSIAWHESHFGKHKMNLMDPSFGVFHNLIGSVIRRNGIRDTGWNRSRLAERLVDDYDFSFSQSLAELKYWQNYWKSKRVSRVWSHMISSYNAGFNHSNGKDYLAAIKLKNKVLRKYIKQHQSLFDALMYEHVVIK